MTNYYSYLETPIGLIELHADEISLLSVQFVQEKSKAAFEHQLIQEASKQLLEYFEGKRTKFDLPLKFNGTPFQEYVWNELRHIPFGTTLSYLQLAKRLGNPKAVRAIGTTNGKNPFAIIIPCHRVIGSNGKLVGYAGGIEKKQWLLEFEARTCGLYLF